MQRPSHPRLPPPWLAAVTVFVLAALAAALLVWRSEEQRLSEARTRVADMAGDHAQALQRGIERALSATYAIAALVRQGNGVVRDYEAVATQLLPFYPGIAGLSLSPGGVIRYVVPLEGNEKSLGFNQLADIAQNREALRARDSGQLTLAGPLQLVQGGLGIVGRLPIFLDDPRGTPQFWGFSNVTIRFPQALQAAQLPLLVERGYSYELWRALPAQGERQVIAASGTEPLDNPVARTLQLPNGVWTLSVSPAHGWADPVGLSLKIAMGLFVSTLLAFMAKLLIELKAHERGLEEQVRERTAEILATQRQLKATLDAIPDPLLEVGLDGRYHGSHSPRSDLPALVDQDASGVARERHISEVFPPEAAEVVMAAVREAHEKGWSNGRQFALQRPHGQFWFELSVSRKAAAEGEPRFMLLSRDITKRKRAEAQLELTAKVFEQGNEGIMITDAQQRVLQVNRAFTQITGYAPADVLGKLPRLSGSGRMSADFSDTLMSALAVKGHWEGESRNRRKDGSSYPQWLSVTRVNDAQGQATHYICIFRDITEHKEAEDRIRRLAHYDPLTGLPNRTLLADRSEHAISIAQRGGTPLALIFLDLDHFKNVNDSLGHRVGDELLKALSQRLRAVVREQDTVSRLGGDEFILVLPGTDAEGAAHVASKLLETAAQPYHLERHELTITPSIGIALFPHDGADFDTLSKCADAAMYRAKQDGRNTFRFFTPEMQARSDRTLQLENALRRALERQQFELHYQPQMALADGRIVGAEALLRWRHPELGMVSPAEFIPVAEDNGLILPIGEWVLRSAAQQARAWMDAGLPQLSVSVNLSAVQFRQAHLPDLVGRILQEAGLPPERLELELTEGAAMEDPRAAIAMMDSLHERGIRMAIDDFGTGYSSLSYLKRFQAYKLKIDQSFVRDITVDPEDRAIVGAIISLAGALGLQTIAEGVETEGQLAFLREHGCHEVQGYLFGRPMAAAEFERLVRDRLA